MKKNSFKKNFSKLTAKEIVNFSNKPTGEDKTAPVVAYVVPRDDIEKKLKTIFELFLTKENISILDKFFRIGGNSLKATQLISQIFKHFNVELNLTEVFENSTIEALAILIKGKKQSDKSGEIKPLEQQLSYSLSSAQYRMWLLCQIQEGNLAYNMSGSSIFDNNFDTKAFEKAIKSLVKRHESLRTIFKEENNEVRQFISKYEDFDFTIEQYDLKDQHLSENAVTELLGEKSRVPFDLSTGPLFKAILIQLTNDKWCFLFVIHHIISDGWSMNIISEEIKTFYEAYKAEKTLEIPALNIHYKEYAAWQLAHLDSEKFEEQKNFWVNKLQGEIGVIDLPSSKTRPAVITQNGNQLMSYITPDKTELLREYCAKKDSSLFIGLLSIWNVLLYRYTSQKDIVIGTPVAGRNHADLENQIGLYVNTMVLRNEIQPEANFDTIFNQIHKETSESYNHQEYPFDELVNNLPVTRNTSRNALFDVMLSLQNIDTDKTSIITDSSILQEIVDLGFCYSKFDIEIVFQDRIDYLQFTVKYNTDVYDHSIIKGLINHYKQLVYKLIESPKQSIDKIDYLEDSEKDTILNVFNKPGNNIDTSNVNTIMDLFRKQTNTAPNDTALVFGEEVFTYEELDSLSNQFAHYLQSTHNVADNELIAIQLKPDNWLIVVILGIIKSGAAYLPLHHDYPEERIAFIKEDSKYKLLIDATTLSQFKSEKDELSTEPTKNEITKDDLAYVIYTSGTTGNPKGVMITHANLESFMDNIETRFRLSDIKRMAVTTNSTFDISVLEMLGGLCFGKELYVFSDEERSNPEKFMKRLHDSQIEAVQLTPSRLSQLYQLNSKFPDELKTMLVGGEALSEHFYTKLKTETFESINVYGPTETTIWSSSLNLKQSDDLSIGAPLENEQIYILDTNNNLVSQGLVGEICIGGKGVAKGYLNRPELTSEKFIKSPFAPNEHIYKTGDLGKWRSDGTISFEGRKDDQVKIRGYRIELGEIENILLQHEEIREVLVTTGNNDDDSQYLAAYMVSEKEFEVSELRIHLKTFLPQYMVPDHFVILHEFPLSTNGKIAKKELPDPIIYALKQDTNYVAPTNDIELKLVEMWESILGREKVGIKDDFFELGGNSIKVMSLSSAIKQEFEINIAFEKLIQEPTIEVLAEDIKLIQWNNSDDSSEETIEIQL